MEKEEFGKDKSMLYKIKSIDKLADRNLFLKAGCINSGDRIKNIPTRSQIEIMHYILEHINENVYQRDLEKVLDLRRATISGILGTMEKNGFIERTIDKNDTRIKKITLSPKAKSIYLKGMYYLKSLDEVLIKDISEDDLKTFNKVIEKMHNNLENNINNAFKQ